MRVLLYLLIEFYYCLCVTFLYPLKVSSSPVDSAM